MPVTICQICGRPIEDNELPAVDDDGAPCHEWCLDDIRNQDDEGYKTDAA